MSGDSKTDNFLKIYLSVVKYGTISQREMIKYQLKRSNLTFRELLDEKSHELYHLCYQKRCCQCGPIDKLPNISCIQKDQYLKLFQQDKTRRNGHDQTRHYLKCCNYALTSASVDDLDFALANTILVHCCQELLWYCCLEAKNKTLQEFLNEKKHVIFHMWISDKSCRSCRNGETLKVEGTIEETDWYLLFKKGIGDEDPSCHVANQNITTSNLDSKLSYELLQELSPEIEISKQLREFRNSFSHHATQKMELEEFEEKWLTIETILLQLACIYGEDTNIRDKLHILKSKVCKIENFQSVLATMKKEQELSDKLNEISIDVSYIKEHICTTEDIKEKIKDIITEIYQQRQHVYVRRSSKEIQSKVLQIKGHAKGTKFHLNKASVTFQSENNPEQGTTARQKFIRRVRRIFRKSSTRSQTTESHEKSIRLCLRLDDPMKTTARYILDETSEQDTIYKADSGEEYDEEIEPSTQDSFNCGQCKKTFASLNRFMEHKQTHMPRQQREVVLKITIEGLPDDLVEKHIEMRIPKGIHLKDARVLDEALGSLIIWTKISTGALKTKDVFFTAIEKVLNEIFSKSPADQAEDRTVDVTIDVSIENDDYENDEEDIFRCGVCSKEFCVLEAFQRHKLRFCRQKNTISVSDQCEVIKYSMNAIPRLRQYQQNLIACIEMDEIKDDILAYLLQYPCALLYSGNVLNNLDFFNQQNHLSTNRISLNTAIRTTMPSVFLCVLRGDYGQLTSIDLKCLEQIRKELPDHLIDKTLYVVTAKSFSGSLRNVHTLSHAISMELGLNMKNIAYRIFKYKDPEIFERMSLYFEYNLVDDVRRHLQLLGYGFKEALHFTKSSEFAKTLRRRLLAEPFGDSLHDDLKNAARSYVWTGAPFTRNKLVAKEAADSIAKFACEELGRKIVETITHNLTVELSDNTDVSNIILKYINLIYLRSFLRQEIFALLIYFILLPFGWIISAIIILFLGTEINSNSFRDSIADEMQTMINRRKDDIIREVRDTFLAEAIQRFKALQIALEKSDFELCQIFSEKKNLNRKNMIEHEFRRISEMNDLIRNFKFEQHTLKIFANGDENNYEDVKKFMDTYFRPDVNTQVIMDQDAEDG